MTSNPVAQAGTALSPEWDRGFDEAFADLVGSDPDWVRAEFDALIEACWDEPPVPRDRPPRPPPCHPRHDPGSGGTDDVGTATDRRPDTVVNNQRSPP